MAAALGRALAAGLTLIYNGPGRFPRCNALSVMLSNANSAKNVNTRQLRHSGSALVSLLP